MRSLSRSILLSCLIAGSYNCAQAQEIIWRGSAHIGDEPGIFGGNIYLGLSAEFPIMLEKFNKDDGTGREPPDDIKIEVSAEFVTIQSGFSGHTVRIFGFKDRNDGSFKWNRMELATIELKSDTAVIALDPTLTQGIESFSVFIQTASDAAPGLYNDFLIRSLGVVSSTHAASYGFHFRIE